MPVSMYSMTRSCWLSLTTGPMRPSSSIPPPSGRFSATPTSWSTTSSWIASWTTSREPAQHICPQFMKMPY
jgi:hypothetical protein